MLPKQRGLTRKKCFNDWFYFVRLSSGGGSSLRIVKNEHLQQERTRPVASANAERRGFFERHEKNDYLFFDAGIVVFCNYLFISGVQNHYYEFLLCGRRQRFRQYMEVCRFRKLSKAFFYLHFFGFYVKHAEDLAVWRHYRYGHFFAVCSNFNKRCEI